MNLFTCPEHGSWLSRIRMKKDIDTELWNVSLLVYDADQAMQDFYKTKAAQARRRGRGHTARRNRPAGKQEKQ